ncbi:MAG: hypothetical protein HOD72_15645 [Opitutae bacterium]|nr:hypothetical protein [Opitutae bacterium]MBT5690965.1 hypothetical protein [Opitutae bacterium]MBT7854791.1 hypothetical protein [Opitutae bacterium]
MKNIGFIAYLILASLITGVMIYSGLNLGSEDMPKARLNLSARSYQDIEASTINVDAEVEWSGPVAQRQGDNWLFDVFTPPKIFVHPKTGKFTAVPYIEEKAIEVKPQNPKPPFGLSFISLYRKPFPVILQSVILSADGDPKKSFIQLEFRKVNAPKPGVSKTVVVGRQSLSGGVGQYFTDQKIKINGIETKRIEVDGIPKDVVTVAVQDFSDLKIYPLQQTKELMTTDYWLTLRSSIDPSTPPIFLKNPSPNTKFSLNQASYEITNVDFVGPKVSLKKTYMHVLREGETAEEVVESTVLLLTGVPSPSTPGLPQPGVLPMPGPNAPPMPIPGLPGVPTTPSPAPSGVAPAAPVFPGTLPPPL